MSAELPMSRALTPQLHPIDDPADPADSAADPADASIHPITKRVLSRSQLKDAFQNRLAHQPPGDGSQQNDEQTADWPTGQQKRLERMKQRAEAEKARSAAREEKIRAAVAAAAGRAPSPSPSPPESAPISGKRKQRVSTGRSRELLFCILFCIFSIYICILMHIF
jgi:hypothetical protein